MIARIAPWMASSPLSWPSPPSAPALPESGEAGKAAPLPVHGLHVSAPAKSDLAAALQFIRKSLPSEGVNTLVMELNYGFNFQSLPEFADPAALGRDEVGELAKACREKGVELIPQINCLGHRPGRRTRAPSSSSTPEFEQNARQVSA